MELRHRQEGVGTVSQMSIGTFSRPRSALPAMATSSSSGAIFAARACASKALRPPRVRVAATSAARLSQAQIPAGDLGARPSKNNPTHNPLVADQVDERTPGAEAPGVLLNRETTSITGEASTRSVVLSLLVQASLCRLVRGSDSS